MASIYAAYDLAAAADLGTGTKALALQTASTIYSRAISGEAVVGYLAISIPFIAWAALKRMENFGTALVGGLSGLQAMISGGTSRCYRRQRFHGERGDGPDATGAQPHLGFHGQLAKRSEREHLLVECADRANRRQPAAQPGICIPNGLDARVRAGRDAGQSAS